MKIQDLLIRTDSLIQKGMTIVAGKQYSAYSNEAFVEHAQFAGFRSLGLSFIASLYGDKHVYYNEFDSQVNNSYVSNINSGINILQSIKFEIENGWLISIRQLIAAEFFSDFLDMAKYFLAEGYKDAAAVMIGSVLEEHLRRLCLNHSIDLKVSKGNDEIPRKADQLNADLTKKGAYGLLEQKNVTAWLDLRNRAAHGKYTEYTTEQVSIMYQGVLDFVTRVH